MTTTIGIDPGLSGAIACMHHSPIRKGRVVRPHYHYAYPHGRPCERQDCPRWVVEYFHAPDDPCQCAERGTKPYPKVSDG